MKSDYDKANIILRVLLIIFVLVIIVYVTAITGGYRAYNGIGFLENITPSNWLSDSLRESFAAINFSNLSSNYSSKFYGVLSFNEREKEREYDDECEGNYEIKKTVIVERGDTLWSILREHYSSEFNGHKLTIMIREINNIESDEFIQPGQELKLPYVDE